MKQLKQCRCYHRRNGHLALIGATVIQHPPQMGAKLVLRVEWNKTLRTRRDPFDTK